MNRVIIHEKVLERNQFRRKIMLLKVHRNLNGYAVVSHSSNDKEIVCKDISGESR